MDVNGYETHVDECNIFEEYIIMSETMFANFQHSVH